jgi:hypothetical protein
MSTHNPIVVYSYTLQQAFDDDVLSPLWENRWWQLTRGKPIVVTASVKADISEAGLVDIWNAYVRWRREVEPTLPDDERLFTTTVNSEQVWLIEDGQAFTILYPSDY